MLEFETIIQALQSIYGMGRTDGEFTKYVFKQIYTCPPDIKSDPVERRKESTYKSYFYGTISIHTLAKSIFMNLDKAKFKAFLITPGLSKVQKVLVSKFSPYIRTSVETVVDDVVALFEKIIVTEAQRTRKNKKEKKDRASSDTEEQASFDFDSPSDNFDDTLLIESGYRCPCRDCDNYLFVEKNGVKIRNFKKVVIDDRKSIDDVSNLIALCPSCALLYSVDKTASDVEDLAQLKKELQERQRIESQFSEEKMITGIEVLLKNIGALDVGELRPQEEKEPVEIKKKIRNNAALYTKVNSYAVSYFNSIEELQKNLTIKGVFKFPVVKGKIKTIYLSLADENISQADIFDYLVKWLMQTGVAREPCEILISYFVQICEVFNDLSQ